MFLYSFDMENTQEYLPKGIAIEIVFIYGGKGNGVQNPYAA